MKHLLTGGSGFLGVYLAKALTDAGEKVRVFDLARSPRLPDGVEFVKGDVRDKDKLIEGAQGVEVVHHLVGLMPQSRAPDDIMQAVNVGGTLNALEAAASAKVRRFVFLSSMEVYGYPKSAPFFEDHELAPIGEYGRNKVESEAMCIRFLKERGLETVSLRPSTLVGPGINEPTFLQSLKLLNKPPPIVPLPAGGKTRFQMTDVTDCVSANMLAATAHGVAGESFNIGADDTVPLREQVSQILAKLGKSARIVSIPGGLAKSALIIGYKLGLSKLEPDHIKLMDTDMVMDCSKAKRMLGWSPKKTNVDMILETLQWYMAELKKR